MYVSPFAFGADLSAAFAGAAPALAGAAAVFAGAATFTGAGSSLSESRHANMIDVCYYYLKPRLSTNGCRLDAVTLQINCPDSSQIDGKAVNSVTNGYKTFYSTRSIANNTILDGSGEQTRWRARLPDNRKKI